ncbi:MAG: AtpZ/AtpI family protein [Eubacterium sp.]|nr:AtpZ/AtpI family protein [Eubacterium sp.]
MDKKDHPLRVYAVVGQIGFLVIVPLLVFIWGGSALIDALGLPKQLMIVCVLLGLLTMVSGTANYLMKVVKMYAKDDEEKLAVHRRRDNDYYDDK